MSPTELLLAFHLNQLASDLRSSAKAKYLASIFDTADRVDINAKIAEWETDHPIELYLGLADDQVRATAAFLAKKTLQGSD